MRRALLVLMALSIGCGPSFDPISVLTGLRLVGVVANPPEVAPGQMSALTATALDTDGDSITIDWSLCRIAPVNGEQVNLDCIMKPDDPGLIGAGSGVMTTVTMPMLAPNELSLPDSTSGFYVPIVARLRAGTHELDAVYRLRYSLGLLPPNQNPVITGIFHSPDVDAGIADPIPLATDAPIDVHVGDILKLQTQMTPESSEMYLVLKDAATMQIETVTETLRVSWLATAGTFSSDATGLEKPDNTWTIDAKHLPPDGTDIIRLFVVARDERGGAALQEQDFHLVR